MRGVGARLGSSSVMTVRCQPMDTVEVEEESPPFEWVPIGPIRLQRQSFRTLVGPTTLRNESKYELTVSRHPGGEELVKPVDESRLPNDVRESSQR